jgi:hypothetical protein
MWMKRQGRTSACDDGRSASPLAGRRAGTCTTSAPEEFPSWSIPAVRPAAGEGSASSCPSHRHLQPAYRSRRRWLCRGRLPGVVDLSVDRFSCAPEHPHDVLDGLRSFKNGAVAPGMRPVFLSSGQGRESLVLGVAEAGVACRDDPPLLRVERIDLQRRPVVGSLPGKPVGPLRQCDPSADAHCHEFAEGAPGYGRYGNSRLHPVISLSLATGAPGHEKIMPLRGWGAHRERSLFWRSGFPSLEKCDDTNDL